MTIELTDTDRRADLLRALGEGPVHVPGDAGYDAARMPWNVAVDQRPEHRLRGARGLARLFVALFKPAPS